MLLLCLRLFGVNEVDNVVECENMTGAHIVFAWFKIIFENYHIQKVQLENVVLSEDGRDNHEKCRM